MKPNELAAMKSSQLIRIMVEHAEAFDKLVQTQPDRYSWDMGHWLTVPDEKCIACLAGAMLYGFGGLDIPVDMEWMHRVDFLRRGSATHALPALRSLPRVLPSERDKELQRLSQISKWFLNHMPLQSAAGGCAWNSEEDAAFYLAYADKLEEAGF